MIKSTSSAWQVASGNVATCVSYEKDGATVTRQRPKVSSEFRRWAYLVGSIPSCFMRSLIAAISGERGWNI
jgi:hypothetical protein